MRLVFDGRGHLVQFSAITPADPGPPEYVTIDRELPAYLVAGIQRAASHGRISYQGGICLDGAAYTPPAIRPDATHTQACAAIAAATTVAQLRAILYRIADELLELGALEL